MDYTSRNERFRQRSSDNVKPIGSIILDLPPSCIEFVPPHRDHRWPTDEPHFVVGTYELLKEESSEEQSVASIRQEQSRQGSLSLFKINGDELTKVMSFRTPSAVLDLHFFPGSSTFAVASSTGTISIFMVESGSSEEGNPRLETSHATIVPVICHQAFPKDTIITSFSWDNSLERDGPRMAVTTNNGAVKLIVFNQIFTQFAMLHNNNPLNQHMYEAWCTAFSSTGHAIWSGGDDSKLRMARITPGSHFPQYSLMPAGPKDYPHNFPGHNAGVTAILPLPLPFDTEQDSILLTGSYDDYVRVYALTHPATGKSKILTELDIGLGGGGVWKLKYLQDYQIDRSLSPDQEVKFKVLACCMRVGAKILEVKGSKNGDWKIEVVAKVGVHESMCYASDAVPARDSALEGWNKSRVVVSTSFYDRLLFVWQYVQLSGMVKDEPGDAKKKLEKKVNIEGEKKREYIVIDD